MNFAAGCVLLSLLSAPMLRGAGPPSDEQIANFWRVTRERLASEPMDAVLEPVSDPLPYRKFRVTLRGLGGVRFRAYLAIPVSGAYQLPMASNYNLIARPAVVFVRDGRARLVRRREGLDDLLRLEMVDEGGNG